MDLSRNLRKSTEVYREKGAEENGTQRWARSGKEKNGDGEGKGRQMECTNWGPGVERMSGANDKKMKRGRVLRIRGLKRGRGGGVGCGMCGRRREGRDRLRGKGVNDKKRNRTGGPEVRGLTEVGREP